jgi:hypothetical protein
VPIALDLGSPVTWITVAVVVGLMIACELVARAKGLTDPEFLGTRSNRGILGIVVELVGAFRLAAPDSWWAQRFYSEAKRERARRHYRDRPDDLLDPPSGESWRRTADIRGVLPTGAARRR